MSLEPVGYVALPAHVASGGFDHAAVHRAADGWHAAILWAVSTPVGRYDGFRLYDHLACSGAVPALPRMVCAEHNLVWHQRITRPNRLSARSICSRGLLCSGMMAIALSVGGMPCPPLVESPLVTVAPSSCAHHGCPGVNGVPPFRLQVCWASAGDPLELHPNAPPIGSATTADSA